MSVCGRTARALTLRFVSRRQNCNHPTRPNGRNRLFFNELSIDPKV